MKLIEELTNLAGWRDNHARLTRLATEAVLQGLDNARGSKELRAALAEGEPAMTLRELGALRAEYDRLTQNIDYLASLVAVLINIKPPAEDPVEDPPGFDYNTQHTKPVDPDVGYDWEDEGPVDEAPDESPARAATEEEDAQEDTRE